MLANPRHACTAWRRFKSFLAGCVGFIFSVTGATAQLISIADQTSTGSVRDGVIHSDEYGSLTNRSIGVNNGFGNVIGAGSKIYFDSDANGKLNLALQSGGGGLNDVCVIYMDSIAGGLSDTYSINDLGGGFDRGRAAISGIGINGGSSKLTFASSFKPDFAIAIESSAANLFRINMDGTLTYIKSLQLLPAAGSGNQQREMELTVGDIGLPSGGAVRWVATLINPSNAYRANELHGSIYAGANIGSNPFTFDNYNLFLTRTVQGGEPISSPVVSFQYQESLAACRTFEFLGDASICRCLRSRRYHRS